MLSAEQFDQTVDPCSITCLIIVLQCMRCSIGMNLLVFLSTAILWGDFLHRSSRCTSKLRCLSIVTPKSF